jgi:hypothetical protein
MSIEVHREVMLQIRQALNRRDYFDQKQLAKRAKKGLAEKCHGFDPSKYNAASMFYLPAQAVAGPDASFFLVHDGGKRRPINPYEWIDKTILNHQPEPIPEPIVAIPTPTSMVRKDPKLTRALMAIEGEKQAYHQESRQERVETAISTWRCHPKGAGNTAFFELAVTLASAGMERAEISRTLHAEAAYAHGRESQRERRAAISGIMKKLRCAA